MVFSPGTVVAIDPAAPSHPSTSEEVSYNDASWKPDGNFGLVVGTQGKVFVFNGTSREDLGSGVNISLSQIAWRPDGSYALIIGEGGTILKFSDVRTGLQRVESGTKADLISIAWKPDGSFALITGAEGVMLRFNHDTQRCIRITTNSLDRLNGIIWDSSGEHAEISSEDGTTMTYPPVRFPVPVLNVLEPVDCQTVSGAFAVRGETTVENGTIAKVDVRIDSGIWTAAKGTVFWELQLDTSHLANGVHTIYVKAISSAGECAGCSIRIIVDNIILPPSIGFSSPGDGAALSGLTVIGGSASSSSGPIERVDIRLDDNDWGAAVGTGAWKVSLDTTTLQNGVHSIRARAWDGLSYGAASITVTVGNMPPAAPSPAPAPARAPAPAPKVAPELTQATGAPANDGTGIPSTVPDGPDAVPSSPLAIPEGTVDGGTITVPMASGGILLLAALAFATEHGKYAIFQFLFVPLYSRIKKDRVLDNFTRGMIYGFIMSNPGVHYNFIKQKLGLNNGSIVYHLTVLERQELIKSEKVGLYKRFYPINGSLSETGLMELNETQEKLLELVRLSPGLTQREVGERMGISSRLINYHVGLLQRSRLVTLEKDGKVTRLYATERMPVC